ncbi:MAG: hypothetical protein AAGG57_07750 [Pseudomonadota bacterium]
MRIAAIALLAWVTAADTALAQSGPAELPPESFTGRQYVDSAGCVYIRGSTSGDAWVPRVNRQSQVICGQRPTLARGTIAQGNGSVRPAIVEPRPRYARPLRPPVNPPVVTGITGVPKSQIPPNARVVPRHVWEKRKLVQTVTAPHGYFAIWEDDRLNIRRAEGTLAGKAAMERVWTQTVPRRLVTDQR